MDTLGVVGNGTYGALVSREGDPIFNSLLNNDSRESGFFDVELQDLAKTEQKYIPNTAVLITTLISKNNDVIQIKDFAPKFVNYDRVFRPFQLFRTVTRIRGDPMVKIKVKPSFDYNSSDGYTTRGSHHLRFCGKETVWRLTTSCSVQAVIEESISLVHEPMYFVFGQDESFAGSLSHVCKEFEDKTVRYWKEKAQTYALPVDYQDIIIRNIITLSIMQSEESGGLLACLTLGVPNGPDTAATRDRRVCELLDTCLSLAVLRDLGMFGLVKKFIEFVKTVSFNQQNLGAICGDLGQRMDDETALEFLAGYKGAGGTSLVGGMRRLPTTADAAGGGDILVQCLLVVSLTQGFFDVRMKDVCSPKLFDRLEKIGDRILALYRRGNVHQTSTAGARSTAAWPNSAVLEYFEDLPAYYSAETSAGGEVPGEAWVFGEVLMWTAIDRLQRVAESMHLVDKARGWRNHANQMRDEIMARSLSADKRHFVSFRGQTHVGPSLLRLAELGFVGEQDPVFVHTIEEYERQRSPDDGGGATAAVLLSTLMWYGEALRGAGRAKEAQSLFHAVCAASSETGLLTEAIDLKTGTLWGNGPSTNAILAFLRLGTRLSRNWRSV